MLLILLSMFPPVHSGVQRQDYKLYNKGRPSRLTPDKIARLDAIGFVWEAQRGGRRRKLEPLLNSSSGEFVPTISAEEAAAKAKADPPGEAPSRFSTANDALMAGRLRHPQGMPSAAVGNSSVNAAARSQQALPRPGTGAAGNPLMEAQQMMTPMQQRQMMSHMGNPGAFPGMCMPSGGFLGPSPLSAPTDVLMRLQQQEQRDRAALAATIAARDSLLGIPPGMPSLPFGAAATMAGMFGPMGGIGRVPPGMVGGFPPSQAMGGSPSQKRSKTAAKKGEGKEDPPDEPAPKRAKTGEKAST